MLQNNAIDMYQTYYTELTTLPAVEHNSCRTVNQFHDFGAQNDESGVVHRRPVSSICWQPDGGHHFAATYVDVDINRQTTSPVTAFVWNMENPNYPESVLAPPCPMLDLQYNPKDIQVLAGGLINGQVCTWDLRQKGVAPALICPPHVAHRDLVKNVLFINSKTGMEFFSGGPDGVCKWWDIRKIHEPTDEMIIDVVTSMTEEQSMAKANGISVMEYEPTIPTRFMVGTENGLVINGNRKGKTPYDKLPAQVIYTTVVCIFFITVHTHKSIFPLIIIILFVCINLVIFLTNFYIIVVNAGYALSKLLFHKCFSIYTKRINVQSLFYSYVYK